MLLATQAPAADAQKWQREPGTPADELWRVEWSGSEFITAGKKSFYRSDDGAMWRPFGKKPDGWIASVSLRGLIAMSWGANLFFLAGRADAEASHAARSREADGARHLRRQNPGRETVNLFANRNPAACQTRASIWNYENIPGMDLRIQNSGISDVTGRNPKL